MYETMATYWANLEVPPIPAFVHSYQKAAGLPISQSLGETTIKYGPSIGEEDPSLENKIVKKVPSKCILDKIMTASQQ